MKNYILTLLLVFTTALSAQDQIVWNQVGVVANDGYASDLAKTIDEFYGSIEMPEGVSVSLSAVYHHGLGHEPTHYLNYAGTVDGLVALRQLRGGPEYDAYVNNFSKYGKTISSVHGRTFMRFNADDSDDPISQVWEWRVEDQAAFVKAFNELVEIFKPDGYMSLGGMFGGISTEGESHYVYVTHNDYKAMLEWGPKTPKELAAFEKFIKTVDAFSEFKGTYSAWTVNTY